VKNLGDHNWLNEYIGFAYEPGGRGPHSYDCFGLCQAIYEDVFDLTLPDWQGQVENISARTRAIDEVLNSGTWEDLDEPIDGCFVVCYRAKASYHLGLYFAGGVIHCWDGCGSIYEPMSRFCERFTQVKFGVWEP
jgi:cell wall-associated NlpC family hydrolase